jgi:predicted Zn-dependent protease
MLIIKKEIRKLGMVVHTCNLALKKLRQEDHQLETSLGYMQNPVSKNKQKR